MVTDEQIKVLKKKHGVIYLIEVEPDEEGGDALQFIFKRPDRATLSAAAKFAATDPIRSGEVVLKNCLVHGPAEALDDMSVFQAVSTQFDEITKARQATIKKL